MPGKAIGISMLNGYPGSFARNADCIIRNRPVLGTDTDSIAFGDPVILNSGGTYSKFGATGTAALFAGVAVREVQQATSYTDQSAGAYAPGSPCDVLSRGSVSVICRVGTPVDGGAVYARVTENTGIAGSVVGGFEYRADTDSDKCILLTNCKWASGKDANGVAELALLTRNNP